MEPLSREYLGGAAVARLTAPLGGTDADRVVSISTRAGWDFTSGALFGVSVNRGKPTEEKMICTVGSLNPDGTGTLTVYVEPSGSVNAGHVYRGWDDTTIQSHPLDATVEHVWTATDAREVHDMLMAHKQALLDVNARFNGTWRSLLPVATP
jgi:hypothetical protein